MSVQVIVGAQWGDEGKGKIVDLLSESADIVARYQGGANAGHTVSFGGATHKLHLIPSGIFHPTVVCVIGNGVVIDPEALLSEIATVEAAGVDITGRLFISHNAHLIMPYHKLLDQAREQSLDAEAKIGTTGRGIGPAYVDKVARSGIRIADLLEPEVLREKITSNLAEKNRLLHALYGADALDVEQMVAEYTAFDEKIDPFVKNTAVYLNRAAKAGKRLLLEGAQGTLLDVDHGTYPFVTSSNPTTGGACTGLGLPPMAITRVTGVVKAYATRVGNGPFPTELHDATGDRLRGTGANPWDEFGTTTGRPRRCGWFDAVILRHAVMINGITDVAVTKLDVLDEFDEIQVCTGYQIRGKRTEDYPTDLKSLEAAEPIYETFPGWRSSTVEIRNYDDLPTNARRYLEALAKMCDTTIRLVSVGPAREQTILVGEG